MKVIIKAGSGYLSLVPTVYSTLSRRCTSDLRTEHRDSGKDERGRLEREPALRVRCVLAWKQSSVMTKGIEFNR